MWQRFRKSVHKNEIKRYLNRHCVKQIKKPLGTKASFIIIQVWVLPTLLPPGVPVPAPTSRPQLKHLWPFQPQRTVEWSPWLLIPTWSSLRFCRYFGSVPVDGDCSFSLSLFLSLCLAIKEINMHIYAYVCKFVSVQKLFKYICHFFSYAHPLWTSWSPLGFAMEKSGH